MRHHLALAALKAGGGNAHLLTDLIRVVYITWYLQQAGFGATDPGLYGDAERALVRCAVGAAEKNVWQLDHVDVPVLERMLALHDWQLERAPLGAMVEVQKRLTRFFQSGRKTPWPDVGT